MIAAPIHHERRTHLKPGKHGKKMTNQIASNKEGNLNGSGRDARHRIAETAYELYEQRGRAEGYDLDDWLKAEVLLPG